MNMLWIALGLVVVGAPIIMSLTVCAPKWWDEKVEHRIPRFMQGTVDSTAFDEFMMKERRGPPIRWVWMLPLALAVTPIIVVAWYCMTVASLIERKCPYTAPREYGMQPGQADFVDAGGGLRKVWNYTLGR